MDRFFHQSVALDGLSDGSSINRGFYFVDLPVHYGGDVRPTVGIQSLTLPYFRLGFASSRLAASKVSELVRADFEPRKLRI